MLFMHATECKQGVVLFLSTERRLVGAVHVGIIQSSLTHALYWLRTISAAEHDRRLVDHGQHAHWCYVLRVVCRPFDDAHTIFRHRQKTLPRKGIVISRMLSIILYLTTSQGVY